MVDIKNKVGMGFSTIFSTRKNFRKNDLKLDSRMIKQLGEQGVKSIRESTGISRLGTFLAQDPEDLAEKIYGKSANQLATYQENAKESFEYLKSTIQDPDLVVRKAIYQCFKFFRISQDEVQESYQNDGTKIFSSGESDHIMRYKRLDRNEQSTKVSRRVSDNLIYAYELEWILRGMTGNKWSGWLDNALASATGATVSLIIPVVGGIISGWANKNFNSWRDQELTEEINDKIDIIFYELFRTNLAIEYISFSNRRLSHSRVVLV